jgi:osmotically-inducible protein OsmY
MQSAPLLHRIDSAIRQNPHVLRRHVFLESAPGRIILRGKVDSFYQKQMVQEVLRGIDGISQISNQLEVEDYLAGSK